MDLVGWDGALADAAAARADGRKVGVGIACYVEGTGVGPYEGAHVVVETSGKVKVATGLTTQGQGHFTSFAQIAADELGVPFEDVEVVTGDTRRFGYAVGTFASRAAVMSGNAIALASRKVRAKALRIAGDALEADPGDLEIVDGVVRVKGSPGASIPLATVAVLSNPLRYAFDEASKAATQFAVGGGSGPPVADGEEPGLEGTGYYSPTQATFANGMHVAIVETDPETAEIHVLRYCVVHDCGPLINPMIVEGQVHGGVAQGVGGALYERMAYDESGQLLNASFMDFLMPYASEVPHIEIDHLETPSPLNPLGIKGAGEAGVIPSAAVFAAAIEDAEGFPVTGCRSRRPSCSTCGAGTPRARSRRCTVVRQETTTWETTDEGQRNRHPERPAGRRLGGPQRPCGPGAHDPRLPAAGGGRAGRLPDDADGGRRVDQGHVHRRRGADRPGAAGRLHPAGDRGRRAGHRAGRRPGHPGRRGRRHDPARLRRGRRGRRHDRRRRPAGAHRRREEDGRGVLPGRR